MSDGNWAVAHAEGGQVPLYRTLLERSEGVLLDWDGCVAIDNKPLPGAVAFMKAYRGPVAILSNNSTNLAGDIAAILAASGVIVDPARIVLAGEEALRRARETAGGVLVLGDARMRAHARRCGMRLVTRRAETVVLLRDTGFSYRRLEQAVDVLQRGGRLIVSNPDATHPGPGGRVVPETGALLAALQACIDLGSVQTEIVGKPAPHLFHAACRTIGLPPEKVVMIGDNPATDIAGARRVGMRAVLVGRSAGCSLGDLAE